MPRLPNATDLSGSGLGPARSFTNIPVPDIAGAARSVAQGVGQVGLSIDNVQKDRREKAAKQERFDTSMALLKADEDFYNQYKDLDRLDPEFPQKARALRIQTHGPILSAVKDPDNKMKYDLATEEDFVRIGIEADKEHRTARQKKQALDFDDYFDGVRKSVRNKTYSGDPVADVTQMIEDVDIDPLVKQELLPKVLGVLNGDKFETEFETIVSGGISVTPSVQSAVTRAVATAGPDAPSYLGDYLLRVAMMESDGGRRKVNPENPEVLGTWQIHSNTAPGLRLALGDRADDEKSAVAMVEFTMSNYRMLKKKLGREPTPAELYLPHQQGIGGAPDLLANPDKRAVDVVKRKAVEQNLTEDLRYLTDTITAKQFADYVMAKFEGKTGGMVDPKKTLETLRLTDSYQNMSADEQAKADETVLKRIDKQNAEAKKSAGINMAREYANTALGAATLVEGNRFIDENIEDPEVREKARTMLKSDWDAKEEEEKAQYEAALEKASIDVENAVISMKDPDPQVRRKAIETAYAAIPSTLSFKDQKALRDRIAKGETITDDQDFLRFLDNLKLGSEEQRKQFASYPLGGENWSLLSRETREKILKEQKDITESFSKGIDPPSLASNAEILKNRLVSLEIDDPATTERMRSMFLRNLEIAQKNKGANLTPIESEDILDKTFIQFRNEGKNQPFVSIEDVFAKFSALDEAQGVPDGTNLKLAQQEVAATAAREKAQAEATIRALENRANSGASRTQMRRPKDFMAEYYIAQRTLEDIRNNGFVNAASLDQWLRRATGKDADPRAQSAATAAVPRAQSAADAAEYAAAEARQNKAAAAEPPEAIRTPSDRIKAARSQFGLDGLTDDEIIEFLTSRGAWPANQKASP